MKKVLALVVAFALCFTALAGCFVTSAADPVINIDFDAFASATEGDVVINGDLGDAANYAAIFTITIDSNFEFVGLGDLIEYDAEEEAAADELGEPYYFDYVKTTDAEGNTVIKELNAHDNGEFDYTLQLVAPANDACKDAEYEGAVVVDLEYADWDATKVSLANATANITVLAGGEHKYGEGVVDPDATCTDEGVETFTCSVCGDTYTEVVSAKGHTAGTPVDNEDGTHTTSCTVCGAVVEGPVDHEYVDGSCACGATEPVSGPVVDSNLIFRDTSVAYGSSSLELSFRIRNTVLELYDNIEVVIIPQRYDTDTLNLVENPTEIVTAKADLAAAGTSNKVYVYTDAYLYELGLDIEYLMRAYDANGNLVAVSETFKTSGAQIIKEIYAKQSANPKMQTLLTDTLIVGQEAINSMKLGKPDSDLAKAESIIGDFDISSATKGYDSYNTIDQFTSNNADVSTDKSAKHRVIKSVTIGKVPYPTYRIKDSDGVFDLDKFGFRIAYTQVDGAGTQTPFDQTFTTANSNAISYVNGYVNFKYESIAIQDSNQDITFEFTYDGEVLFTSVYSMETFLGANLTNANTGSLMDALIKLGVSFRAYSAK